MTRSTPSFRFSSRRESVSSQSATSALLSVRWTKPDDGGTHGPRAAHAQSRRSDRLLWLSSLIACGLVLVAGPAFLRAEEPGDPLTIGRTVKIHSEALAEDRTILVTTPAGYEQGARKYPVVYVLDGETNHLLTVAVTNFFWQNGQMPSVIVVSVTNTDRTRDFTPTAVADRQGSGGGPKFMEFLKRELIPFVEKNYRTLDYRILIGHSLCGMYAVYSLASEPDLFPALIAISPYVMYDDDYVLRLAEEKLPGMSDRKRFLYITLGNEPEYNASIDRLLGLLKKRARRTWKCTSTR